MPAPNARIRSPLESLRLEIGRSAAAYCIFAQCVINGSLIAAYFLIRNGPTAMAQMVEQALEDVSGGRFVDELGAATARKVGIDHAALHRGGRKPLVPEGDRKLGMCHEVLRELPHALRPRAVAAVECQRQADNDAADLVAC